MAVRKVSYKERSGGHMMLGRGGAVAAEKKQHIFFEILISEAIFEKLKKSISNLDNFELQEDE